MLHSVGTPQPDASVFAGRWNRAGTEVAVHAVLQADGTVYQCLPWNYRGWHAGGSANDTHVGVEMTEPACIRYHVHLFGPGLSAGFLPRHLGRGGGAVRQAVPRL